MARERVGVAVGTQPIRSPGLWHAARIGDCASISSLLSLGDSVNRENAMYETPLYLAALEGQEAAVNLLLDNGALVNITETGLNTPLHAAAAGGHVGIAALLLERGGNPHQLNEEGVSPVVVAQGRADHVMEAVLSKADEPVPCQQACGQVVLRRLMAAHVKRDCPHRMMTCRLFCGEEVPFVDVMDHEANHCMEAEVPCTAGCGSHLRRREMPRHLELTCPCASTISCRFGCRVLVSLRTAHEDEHLLKPANEWTATEFCFWAERELRVALGRVGEEPSGPGFGPGAFLGTGIRTTVVDTWAMSMQCVEEAMTAAAVTGHTMAQMAAHKYPVDAVSWMLKAMTVMTDYRRILVPAWIRRCNGDGSALACSKASCMALAVGVVTRFRIIGDLITTRESTLADARRAIDTNPRFRDAVPEKYVMVSSQFYRPVPEPFEGRYVASTMGFIVLVQDARQQIISEVPGAGGGGGSKAHGAHGSHGSHGAHGGGAGAGAGAAASGGRATAAKPAAGGSKGVMLSEPGRAPSPPGKARRP